MNLFTYYVGKRSLVTVMVTKGLGVSDTLTLPIIYGDTPKFFQVLTVLKYIMHLVPSKVLDINPSYVTNLIGISVL